MTESKTTSDPYGRDVHATEWAIILSDWQKSDAWVTAHLKGGATLGPGKVSRLPGAALDSVELRDPQRVASSGYRRETRWTFDLNDVAAITAEASR
ncbi:MAG TPA: hypothetical protein VIP28_00245 [Nocardioides sp.]